MGFFRRVGRAISRVGKSVARVTAGVATFGLSEVYLRGKKIEAKAMQGATQSCGYGPVAQSYAQSFYGNPAALQSMSGCAGYGQMCCHASSLHQLAQFAQAVRQAGGYCGPAQTRNAMMMAAFYQAGFISGRQSAMAYG